MNNDESFPSLLVRFQFDGDKKPQVANLTYEQYSNIKELPITVECQIVKNEEPTLSKSDVALLDKKLAEAFKKSKSHTKSLSE